MADDNDNAKKVNPKRLKDLGFSDDLIKEAVEREESGALDVEPSSDLLERILERAKNLKSGPKP